MPKMFLEPIYKYLPWTPRHKKFNFPKLVLGSLLNAKQLCSGRSICYACFALFFFQKEVKNGKKAYLDLVNVVPSTNKLVQIYHTQALTGCKSALNCSWKQFYDEHEKMGRKVEEGLLVFAVPGSWFYLIFFAG